MCKGTEGTLYLQCFKQFKEAKWWWDEGKRVIRMKIRLG